MMVGDLQVGDVVTPKSGGPRMTVDEVEESRVHCVWFAGSEQNGSHFAKATVKKTASGPVTG